MSKSQQRHRRRLARYLGNLAESNPQRFQAEWRKRVESWAEDIHAIGRQIHRPDSLTPETKLFEVLEVAEKLLASCGLKAQALVGAQTRQILLEECCRVFAQAVSPEMHKLVNSYSNYLLMKYGSHKPPR